MTVGANLPRLRREALLTQGQLAERAGLSVDVVRKLEQGQRGSARTATLIALATALDVDLSELIGKRPRLDRSADGRVLALRDALLAPELLDAYTPTDADDAPGPEEVGADVAAAWDAYWAGRLSPLAALLPGLVSRARAAHREHGPRAAGALAQSYQLIACLLVHMGKDDLAVLSAERAVVAAGAGDDELQWATVHGAYAWTLLHQGRWQASEAHALAVAERIEPSFTRAPLEHLTVWGSLVLTAMAAAAAGGRKDEAVEYIGLARTAAGRFDDGDRHDYELNFGPTQVAMQTTHAYALFHEPSRALRAAGGVRREDLRTISWGRHLIDVAQAQVVGRDFVGAERTLLAAEATSTEWFRHQGPARALVGDLVEQSRRLSPGMRQLAEATRLR